MNKKRLVALSVFLFAALLMGGCAGKTASDGARVDNQTGQLPALSLPSTPEGWISGTEGWIPPVPRGVNQPLELSAEDWNRVIAIARTDSKVAEQIGENNIADMQHWWVGYGGSPGFYANPDSAFASGEVRAPERLWYYPAVMFIYRSRTDRNGQLVGVELKTGNVVLSNPSGLEIPRKPAPPR